MTGIRNFDAEFCGKVPLHQTNFIQPHGVLLVIQKGDWQVLQASENTEAVFAMPASEMVQQRLDNILSGVDMSRLEQLFMNNRSGKLTFSFTMGGRRFLSLVQQHERYYLFEIEKEPQTENEASSFMGIYEDLKMTMAAIDACTSTLEVCRVVAKEIKRLSGFDKVMVYCFDENWNGDVIAEEMEPGMESYLGLKFPASDIPKPARELYKKSPYRLIPTIHYEGVRLYPVINPSTHSFTDLSNCNLRSVAAVHLEYLANMKVDASMSTRILKDGELWGLISCHHRTPRYLSHELCSMFELLSAIISAKIAAVQHRDSFQYKSDRQELRQQLVETVLATGSLQNAKEALLQLLDADGIAIIGKRQIDTAGVTPGRLEIEELMYWLQANELSGLYHQPALPQVYEAAEAYAGIASGLLALPIESDKGDYLLAFRTEAVRQVDWGGNPNEAVQFESNGKQYHPRSSFRIWQQTVRQTALPWRPEALELADSLRNFLVESRLNRKYL